MLTVLTDEEAAALCSAYFAAAEPGFVIQRSAIHLNFFHTHLLVVVGKDEMRKVLFCHEINPDMLQCIEKNVPLIIVEVPEREILNLYATTITDAMCRENDAQFPHCRSCGNHAVNWDTLEVSSDDQRRGKKNYRVDANGLCRHIDCNDVSKSE
jgi:hypothetical protein